MNFQLFTITTLITILLSFSAQGQTDIKCYGNWQFKLSNKTFCNIQLDITNKTDNGESIALISGKVDGNNFKVKTYISSINNRNAIVLKEITPQEKNSESFVLILVTDKSGHKINNVIWGDLNITKSKLDRDKELKIKKIKASKIVQNNETIISMIAD